MIDKEIKIIINDMLFYTRKMLKFACNSYAQCRKIKYIYIASEAQKRNEFMKEQWFSRQCSKIGIPVPRIMHTGKYCNIDFLIEEYIQEK